MELATCEELVPIIGTLFREKSVRVCVKHIHLLYKSPLELLGIFNKYNISAKNLLSKLKTTPINKNINLYIDAENTLESPLAKHRDVILYGFGRIGRAITRIMLSSGNYPLSLRYIVIRPGTDIKNRINLLKRDSVHGSFKGSIQLDGNMVKLNDHVIQFIEAASPDKTEYPADLVNPLIIDNTGKWRDFNSLNKHINSLSDAQVIVTCPADDIPNIVFGINHQNYLENKIISAASCTTNAVVPILFMINNKYTILHGHLETVHSYTNDQNLIDNYHKKPRRDRAAALNLVPSTTGASQAAGKCIPELKGKLTSSALRIPIPDVSLAIMTLELEKNTTINELHQTLFKNELIGTTNNEPAVSTDLIGATLPCVVDTDKTSVMKNKVILYVWYDNEIGYSWQTVRLAEMLTP